VRPAILWSDGRTAAFVQDAYRTGLSGEVFQITGTALNTCNQGFHLVIEQGLLQRFAAIAGLARVGLHIEPPGS
jgi:sugar (pentulose or hexulose) kinase